LRLRKEGKEELFFFEKKNQKTFVRLGDAVGRQRASRPDKSLFASFSSEKEDLASYAFE
jgi:hypothetical protein